jgi:pimeloyl-ACP methyl ester carboxylesterase
MKLILMPGMDGTGILFKPLLAALSSDLPSTVLSYPTDQTLGYAELLPLVRAALPADTPYILVGESFSGPLALMVAAGNPPGLRGVVLVATFVRSPVSWAPPFLRYFVRASALQFFAALTQAKALLGRYGSAELRSLLQQANSAASPEVLAHRIRSIMSVNVVAELVACTVPIMYIRGTRDRVVPERCLRLILRERPKVQIVRLEAPHLVLQVQPGGAASAIHSFAASAGAV